VSEAKPFWCGFDPFAIEDHHSLMSRPAHCLGKMPWMPSHSFKSSQILTV
jgi:hypothetical protein